MTNRQIMLSALKKYVIFDLLDKGFQGKYPDYKRVCYNYIEMICFQTNKWGGSFLVETSVVFPNAKNTNIISCSGAEENIEIVNVSCTNERYRLDGMFDGEFYYSDVYKKEIKTGLFKRPQIIYESCLNKEDAPDIFDGYKCVQQFDKDVAIEICNEINKQLTDAFLWMKNFEKVNLN